MPTLVYFLIWGAFFFFMMRFGCGAHIMGHSSHRHDDRNRIDPNTMGVASNTQPIANAERNNEHQH